MLEDLKPTVYKACFLGDTRIVFKKGINALAKISPYFLVDSQIVVTEKIILHAGGEGGFVKTKNEDGSLIFCSKNKSMDCHENMDATMFKNEFPKNC